MKKVDSSSLYRKSARKAKNIEPPYKDAFLALDKKWGDIDYWRIFKRESGNYTKAYYLRSC